MFVATTATRRISEMTARLRAVPGGTSASKTVSIIILLTGLAQGDKSPKLASIVSESVPHLKRGAIRDFKNIMKEHRYWRDSRWNVQDSIYTFETGSQIEFFSSDNGDKLRGSRRDRLFINEANNVSFEAFEQLEVRTREFVFLDWNPSSEFWYYTEVKGKRDDLEELTLTYLDNEALEPEIIASLEQRKNRKNWWKVYGLGQLGEIEGKIYTNWQFIDEIPHEAEYERTGLDFGYTNDPTAIVDTYKYNGGIILDEVAFAKGLSNKQIADTLKQGETFRRLVIADAAEPKSIDEISAYQVSILPAVKGPGSVNRGIDFVQSQRVSVTKRSVNVIADYRNYMWLVDKNGKVLNDPDHFHSDSMDAVRYALSSMQLSQEPDAAELRERAQTRARLLVNQAR